MLRFSLIRKLLTLLPFFFLLGSGLLLFFILLSGASSSSSLLQKFYWIKAQTPGLGSYSETKWTNYRLCDAVGNLCGSSKAGLPISPKDNFPGSSSKLASAFVNSRNSFYYESRIAWLFLLISTFFVILAILMSIPSLCASSTILVSLGWVTSLIAFVFLAVSALLYTHVLTKAKRAFKNNGQSAHIGTKMMAFLWTTVLLLLLTTFFTFLLGCCQFASNRYETNKERESEAYDSDEVTYNDGLRTSPQRRTNNRSLFWKRGAGAETGRTQDNTAGVTTDEYHPEIIGSGAAGAGVVGDKTTDSNVANTEAPSKINFFRVRNNRDEVINDSLV